MTQNMLASLLMIVFGVSILCTFLAIALAARYRLDSKVWEIGGSIIGAIMGICALVSLLLIGALYDVRIPHGNNPACGRSNCVDSPQGSPARPQVGRSGRTPASQGKAPPTQTQA